VRLAPVPPRSSVLPPGAGNEEAKKAVKTGKQRAKKTEERSVVEVRTVQRNLDVPAIAREVVVTEPQPILEPAPGIVYSSW